MKSSLSSSERQFFAPEVVQTSAMDCGPAALKSLLEGFGIPISYGRLREACQTDVDGTSIDTLEDVAGQLGLRAQQLMIPVDHLLLPEADLLPALVVIVLPSGLPHFVVIWRIVGAWVQVMDPAVGRRWIPQQRLLSELYVHRLPFPAAAWRDWAASTGLQEPLRRRLENLRLGKSLIEQLLAEATADATWYTFGVLDAATRFVSVLARNQGIQRGSEAALLLNQLFQQVRQSPANAHLIPHSFWSVLPLPSKPTDGTVSDGQLILRGAVLIQVLGRQGTEQATDLQEGLDEATTTDQSTVALSPELAAALAEAPSRPEFEILKLLRQDGVFTPLFLIAATLLAAATVTLEASILRGLLGAALPLIQSGKVGILVTLCLFALLLLLLEFPLASIRQRSGRRLETRLRVALLEKIPRLGDHYFRSRLLSDMVERAYSLHSFHRLPDLVLRMLEVSIQLLLTAVGVILIFPAGAPGVLIATGFAIGAAFLSHPLLSEREMRVRTHNGALSRFYLDALLGLTPIRSHSAERVVRREHELLLVEWVRSNFVLQRDQRSIQALVSLVGMSFAIWIVFSYLIEGGEASGVLLLLYWTLNLPALGQSMVSTFQQYPVQRNQMLRLLEPLGAPEEENEQAESLDSEELRPEELSQTTHTNTVISETGAGVPKRGVAIRFENVTAQAAGHTILSEINATIQAGEHIAIVGPSGAGKSSLAGLLLGWLRPAEGQIWVEGEAFKREQLAALRNMTAWVDPAVQIWNRSLEENLTYGTTDEAQPTLGNALESADLYDVLEQLPDGLETKLGESGGLVSGGEGQRVRFGRALVRPQVRLAILDEPFRGLDRAKRHQLLANARRHWQAITLLCITHDVGETTDFERVWVVEGGRIVEDGSPARLMNDPHSRYRALLTADEMVRRTLWQATVWRKLWLENGELNER